MQDFSRAAPQGDITADAIGQRSQLSSEVGVHRWKASFESTGDIQVVVGYD